MHAMQCQFFQNGSISVGLNKDIIHYLSKIKQIATDNNLILLESTLNNENLYEILPKSKRHKNTPIYVNHFDNGPKSNAAFYTYVFYSKTSYIQKHTSRFDRNSNQTLLPTL